MRTLPGSPPRNIWQAEQPQPDDESKPELNIIQAIELAIAHETEARKSYLSLSQETDDPELKTLLKEIAMEEASHEASPQEPPAPLPGAARAPGHLFPVCEPGVVRRDLEEPGAAGPGGAAPAGDGPLCRYPQFYQHVGIHGPGGRGGGAQHLLYRDGGPGLSNIRGPWTSLWETP